MLQVVAGDLEDRRPAEISAVLALGGLEVLEHVATRDARGTAAETFHDERFHPGSIGGEPRFALPETGELLPVPGGGEELIPRAELHPRATDRLAGCALCLVDRRPI